MAHTVQFLGTFYSITKEKKSPTSRKLAGDITRKKISKNILCKYNNTPKMIATKILREKVGETKRDAKNYMILASKKLNAPPVVPHLRSIRSSSILYFELAS